MSFSSVGGGGFQGGDALLAFAAVQQGRMNDEMSESMRIADLRSQAAADLSKIKSDIEQANRHPEDFPAFKQELDAFVAKYGGEPALEDLTSTIITIQTNVQSKLDTMALINRDRAKGNDESLRAWVLGGSVGNPPASTPPVTFDAYVPETIQDWTSEITGKLDAAGTNDQLTMIHIKQLNDNINNSSGMVSGIIESRQNATASIINNIA